MTAVRTADDVRGLVARLLVLLDDRVAAQDTEQIRELLDAEEWALAANQLITAIIGDAVPLTTVESRAVRAIAALLRVTDLVADLVVTADAAES